MLHGWLIEERCACWGSGKVPLNTTSTELEFTYARNHNIIIHVCVHSGLTVGFMISETAEHKKQNHMKQWSNTPDSETPLIWKLCHMKVSNHTSSVTWSITTMHMNTWLMLAIFISTHSQSTPELHPHHYLMLAADVLASCYPNLAWIDCWRAQMKSVAQCPTCIQQV